MWDDPALDVAPITPFPSTFQVRRTQDDSSYEWAPMEVLLFPYDIIRQNVNQLRNTGSTFMTYLDISHSQVDITSWRNPKLPSLYAWAIAPRCKIKIFYRLIFRNNNQQLVDRRTSVSPPRQHHCRLWTPTWRSTFLARRTRYVLQLI